MDTLTRAESTTPKKTACHVTQQSRGEATMPRVTVFVPTYNEADAIEECLMAVLKQDYPHDHIEVLVVDGKSDDETVAIVERMAEAAAHQTGLSVRVLHNAKRDLAAAWNLAAREATGDYIALVVAHSLIAPDYVSRAVAHLQENVSDVVGGPYRMVGKSPAGKAIAAAMSCRFGVGQSSYRYGEDVQNIQSVGNAIYPIELLRRFLPFDRSIGKGEDWEMHYRMRMQDVTFAQFADIRYVFDARPSLKSLCKQQFDYARAKVNIIRKHGLSAVRATHFIPLFFVLFATLGALICAFTATPLPMYAWGSGMLLYAGAVTAASISSAARHGWRMLPLMPWVFMCMHVAYGFGMLKGFSEYRQTIFPRRSTTQGAMQ